MLGVVTARPPVQPYRIALLNPNTSTQSTDLMMASALSALPAGARIEGRNVHSGPAFITEPAALAEAADAVDACADGLVAEGFDAIIIAGFGDPGLGALRRRLGLPITGLGEAGIAEAARDGLPYAIVTVTPDLHASLLAAAHAAAPPAQLVAIRYTQGPLASVMHSADSLEGALLRACQDAITTDGAQSIVIGGGPLAQAAREIAAQLHIRVVDPVCAAVRLACARGGLAP
jgi:Asp/Glu/hydantoin racemase